MIPEEDKQPICEHKWESLNQASGFSRKAPDIYVVLFCCGRCLMIRKKILDISDQKVPREVEDWYEEDLV